MYDKLLSNIEVENICTRAVNRLKKLITINRMIVMS